MIHVVCIDHHGAIYKGKRKEKTRRPCRAWPVWAAENPYILGPGRGKNSGEPGPYNISIHDSIRHLLENIEYKRFEAIV